MEDINSLHFDGYRPSTVQELLMKNKVQANSPYKPPKQYAQVNRDASGPSGLDRRTRFAPTPTLVLSSQWYVPPYRS